MCLNAPYVIKCTWPRVNVSLLAESKVFVSLAIGALGLIFVSIYKRSIDIVQQEDLKALANLLS